MAGGCALLDLPNDILYLKTSGNNSSHHHSIVTLTARTMKIYNTECKDSHNLPFCEERRNNQLHEEHIIPRKKNV